MFQQSAAATQNDNIIASLKVWVAKELAEFVVQEFALKCTQDDVVTLKEDVKRLQSIALTEHVAASAADAAATAACRWIAAPLGQVAFTPRPLMSRDCQCRSLCSARSRKGFLSSLRQCETTGLYAKRLHRAILLSKLFTRCFCIALMVLVTLLSYTNGCSSWTVKGA